MDYNIITDNYVFSVCLLGDLLSWLVYISSFKLLFWSFISLADDSQLLDFSQTGVAIELNSIGDWSKCY